MRQLNDKPNRKLLIFIYALCFVGLAITLFSLNISMATYDETKSKLNEINIEQYEINHLTIDSAKTAVRQKPVELNKSILNPKLNIVYDDGFKVNDSTLKLKHNDSIFSFYLSGMHKISYDSRESFISIDEDLSVKLVDASLVDEDITCVISDSDDTLNVIAQKKIDKNTAISIIKNTTEKDKDSDKKAVEEIISTVVKRSKKWPVKFSEIDTPIYTDEIVVADNGIIFIDGEDEIFLTKYEKSYSGAGFDTTLDIDGVNIKYSDMKDSETGYSPYLLKESESVYKILSTSKEAVENLFV